MATNAELLAAAREAKRKLLAGEMEAEIRTADGESVKYAPASIAELNGYIAELETKVDPSSRRRSIKVFYG